MKTPIHHFIHPQGLFDHFHQKIHHAFVVVGLAIVGMLWGASNILSTTSASWQWGGFLSSEFWNQNPSNENIIYTLFGDGTVGSTAYTQSWDASCIPTSVTVLSTGYAGGNLGSSNTIYILTAGNYALTQDITVNGNCIALIGKPNTFVNQGNYSLVINNKNKVIVDGIFFKGNLASTGIQLNGSTNITLNNLDLTRHNKAISNTTTGFVMLSNSRVFYNVYGAYIYDGISSAIGLLANNSQIYNNQEGIVSSISLVNNSQIYNNTTGISAVFGIINNSTLYNNTLGASYQAALNTGLFFINNSSLYNNTLALKTNGVNYYFGTVKFFGNDSDIGGSTVLSGESPLEIGSWVTPGQLETGDVVDYQWLTNPQDGSGNWLLSGTIGSLRGVINNNTTSFSVDKRPIRYIFGSNVLKQTSPLLADIGQSTFHDYGTDKADYTTTKYIAEPESSLPLEQQTLVDQYFGSDSTFTQNWETNGCSLSAFQIKTLNPGTFTLSNNTFEDHTLYILTGGEYKSAVAGASNGFVFNGNCIALVGNNTTKFTKQGLGGMASILYANNKHNIIIDNIKIDGLYYGNVGLTSPIAKANIKFDGTTNNSTINNVQAANTSQYGIFLGIGSHHNTIINSQVFNNTIAGIYFYYSSNYNVINNTQTYNNGSYGIRFANGSKRNTMNNFQAYNNTIGVYGDLTSQENVINRAAIYNNSDAGIVLKNTSGNILNDVMVYNNVIGIRTVYGSQGNMFYGELNMFANSGGNFEGTIGNDSYLGPGSSESFEYPGVLTTGTIAMSCAYATNPTLSGTTTTLLNTLCTNRGSTGFIINTTNSYATYAFGLNMYKQTLPFRYDSGNTLVEIPSQYDATKYIAEVFAIWDTTPENVYFASTGRAEADTWYMTNVYTASALNLNVPVSVSFLPSTTSGYLILSGVVTGLTGIVSNGTPIQIAVFTRTGYNEVITGTITIGTVSTGFTVITRGYNQVPDTGSFAFGNLNSISLSTFTGSTVMVGGIETGVLASITFSPSTTSGRLEIYSGSTLITSGTSGLSVYSGNTVKAIAQSSSGYGQTITGYITIGQGTGMFTLKTKGSDTIPPSTPTITYPLTGEELFFISFDWIASVDTGSGIYGYEYEIAEDNGFLDVVTTGFVATTTGITGSPNENFIRTSGKYYIRIRAKDGDDNTSSRSNIGYFKAIKNTNREFTSKTNANLRTLYDSNEITIKGMKPTTSLWISVDENGILYKNGIEKGTGAYVQNDDKIYVLVRSSNRYDKSVSTFVTLANKTLEFEVTTKEEGQNGCALSSGDAETIEEIFDSLVENYSGDEERYTDFLSTIQSMLRDEIDFTNDCNLKYLQGLINGELGVSTTSSGNINTGTTTGLHIAPNCKEYIVYYDSTRMGYTSSGFKIATFFANRDTLGRYIDSKNPGDCHLTTYGVASWIFTNTNPSKHIASNGKIYLIQSDPKGYTSSDFVVKKYFATLAGLRNFIDSKNPPQQVRSHEVDTTFAPQNYIAPNAKEYTIYKTNRGYMSYKLLTVRYFDSLSEIQSFISRNNK